MSAMPLVNRESDVAGIPLDVGNRTASQVDRAKLFAGFCMDHTEITGRDFVDGVVFQSEELQHEIAIAKRRWFKRLENGDHIAPAGADRDVTMRRSAQAEGPVVREKRIGS